MEIETQTAKKLNAHFIWKSTFILLILCSAVLCFCVSLWFYRSCHAYYSVNYPDVCVKLAGKYSTCFTLEYYFIEFVPEESSHKKSSLHFKGEEYIIAELTPSILEEMGADMRTYFGKDSWEINNQYQNPGYFLSCHFRNGKLNDLHYTIRTVEDEISKSPPFAFSFGDSQKITLPINNKELDSILMPASKVCASKNIISHCKTIYLCQHWY